MKILSKIYPNKAYSCILFFPEANRINSEINTYDDKLYRSNAYDSLEQAIQRIGDFYRSMDLRPPTENDFIPHDIIIEEKTYLRVKWVKHTYILGFGKFSMTQIVSGLDYKDAIARAKAISRICVGVHD